MCHAQFIQASGSGREWRRTELRQSSSATHDWSVSQVSEIGHLGSKKSHVFDDKLEAFRDVPGTQLSFDPDGWTQLSLRLKMALLFQSRTITKGLQPVSAVNWDGGYYVLDQNAASRKKARSGASREPMIMYRAGVASSAVGRSRLLLRETGWRSRTAGTVRPATAGASSMQVPDKRRPSRRRELGRSPATRQAWRNWSSSTKRQDLPVLELSAPGGLADETRPRVPPPSSDGASGRRRTAPSRSPARPETATTSGPCRLHVATVSGVDGVCSTSSRRFEPRATTSRWRPRERRRAGHGPPRALRRGTCHARRRLSPPRLPEFGTERRSGRRYSNRRRPRRFRWCARPSGSRGRTWGPVRQTGGAARPSDDGRTFARGPDNSDAIRLATSRSSASSPAFCLAGRRAGYDVVCRFKSDRRGNGLSPGRASASTSGEYVPIVPARTSSRTPSGAICPPAARTPRPSQSSRTPRYRTPSTARTLDGVIRRRDAGRAPTCGEHTVTDDGGRAASRSNSVRRGPR